MSRMPTPAEMHDLVRPLDDLDRKVLGGLVLLWIAAPQHVRDREWTAERFVQVATVAHGLDGDAGPATTADVERIQAYAQQHMARILQVGLSLFVRVAEDLKQRGAGFAFADAQHVVRSYLVAPTARE